MIEGSNVFTFEDSKKVILDSGFWVLVNFTLYLDLPKWVCSLLRFRSGRYNFAPSSFGAVSKLEIASGDKERAFTSSGLIYNKSQGLIRLYSARDVFSRFFGIHKLSSIADAKDNGDEEQRKEELCKPEDALRVTGDVTEGVDDDSLFESELGSDVDASDDDLEIEVEHSNEGKGTKKRARSELFESIAAYKSVKHVLEVWVKEGKDLSQAEVSLAIHNLRKRRSYAMCLQVKFSYFLLCHIVYCFVYQHPYFVYLCFDFAAVGVVAS